VLQDETTMVAEPCRYRFRGKEGVAGHSDASEMWVLERPAEKADEARHRP
jgi:hypothetical protein